MAISRSLGVGVGVGVLSVTDAGSTATAVAGRGKLVETRIHEATSPTCNRTNSLRLNLAIGDLVTGGPLYGIGGVKSTHESTS
jgi:hypothetical protein